MAATAHHNELSAQIKWIYARFYLGVSVKEIAQAEGVDYSWIYKSIKRGLKHLAKKFEKI